MSPVAAITNSTNSVAQSNTDLSTYGSAGQKSHTDVTGPKLRCWQGFVPLWRLEGRVGFLPLWVSVEFSSLGL